MNSDFFLSNGGIVFFLLLLDNSLVIYEFSKFMKYNELSIPSAII